MRLIATPFGILMMWLYNVTQNYGVAIILFAIIVRLIMLPFQMKSKKGMMRTQLIQPRQQELQKKYGSNQQKYSEELQKLYKEEGVNPMGGCLWSLIPFPVLIALYYAIREPLTTMMQVPTELLAEGGAIAEKLTELGFELSSRSAYAEIEMSKFISDHFEAFSSLSDKLVKIDYNFLGIDLGATPNWQIWTYDFSDPAAIWPQIGLFLIPIAAAGLSYLQSVMSQKLNPSADPQAAATSNSMMMMMPLMTIFFCFMMPGALGLYWAIGSVISIVQELILTDYYKKQLAVETAESDRRRAEREAELEAKRAETERLKAAGEQTENESTSKKKKALREKQEREKAEREYNDAKTGEEKYEPSRVGHRKYARGRAYDPDRYTRKEENTEETAEE
ncbi:MAG: membrane protein insertase YidC [Oscillospiraceae bacterium]|nr:membrane protein insertase YidC [Oscillospiraceae bacterium]